MRGCSGERQECGTERPIRGRVFSREPFRRRGELCFCLRHRDASREPTAGAEWAHIARVGLQKIARGETVSVEKLDANYIRRSDAEIFSKP